MLNIVDEQLREPLSYEGPSHDPWLRYARWLSWAAVTANGVACGWPWLAYFLHQSIRRALGAMLSAENEFLLFQFVMVILPIPLAAGSTFLFSRQKALKFTSERSGLFLPTLLYVLLFIPALIGILLAVLAEFYIRV